MAFELPNLPYPKDALAPIMSAETLTFHHDKHHNAYVTKLNELIKGTPFEGKTLEEIVKTSSGGMFNQAGQHYNHSFFWECLTPKESEPTGELKKQIDAAFGDYKTFQTQFMDEGKKHFGSGWVWLVKKDGKLAITSTHDGDCALKHGDEPLLVCDLWEHAYYIDYRNERPKFLESIFKRINWAFVEKNLNAETRYKAPRG